MTFSIVARDPATGAFGVAVATRFFAVGALCPHAEGGVGALATQALINPLYGLDGLAMLRKGGAANDVVAALTDADPGRAARQVHLQDAQGRIAAYTGADCIPWCGHRIAERVSVAGNMLAGPAVVDDTLRAYQEAISLPFAERLIHALKAGEAAGGDKRGRQSAALRIHTTEAYPALDLRVDDHEDPLAELERLEAVSRERFTHFAQFFATRALPGGIHDRAVIEAGIAKALAGQVGTRSRATDA
ncbi:MAG: DUF1028 domain-containing protein [Betaproteobacteria bacterium]|nr:DUF1028 domain-containing protein [Betaproteobacteria bacterium]